RCFATSRATPSAISQSVASGSDRPCCSIDPIGSSAVLTPDRSSSGHAAVVSMTAIVKPPIVLCQMAVPAARPFGPLLSTRSLPPGELPVLHRVTEDAPQVVRRERAWRKLGHPMLRQGPLDQRVEVALAVADRCQ